MSLSSDLCRRLVNNSRTYNQIELFFIDALNALMLQRQEQGQRQEQIQTHYRSLEEHINEIFGTIEDAIDASHMNIRSAETLLGILRIDHSDLYNQLFCSTIMVIKTIIQKFVEDGRFPIAPINNSTAVFYNISTFIS